MRQRVPFVSNQADVLITAFGPAELLEFAPTVNELAFSFAMAVPGAINLRIFYAPAAGAAANNQIEVFNKAVSPGVIAAGGNWVTIIGGQGGCERAWRDESTGAVWTLRATVTGLGVADDWNARIEWIIARGVT